MYGVILSPIETDLAELGVKLGLETCLNPATIQIKNVTDKFLNGVQKIAEEVISTTNFDCIKNPEETVGKVFDVRLQGIFLRARITSYDKSKQVHHFNPEKFESWPDNLDLPSSASLINFGEGESFTLVPDPFQLRYNPIEHPSNIGKRYYCQATKRFMIVQSIEKLIEDLYEGNIKCQHNQFIAQRYSSGSRRGSNASRQGVT